GCYCSVPSLGWARGQDSQGRQARRSSVRGSHELRVRSQSQDRQGARPRGADIDAAARQRGDRMRRRDALTLLGGAAAWPLAARAQPGKRVRTVGFLVSTEDNSNLDDRVAAFRQELQRLGWGEGRIRFEVRNTSADQAQIRALAAELLALSPDVMMTITNLVTTIAARLTKTIPIVFVAADPMGS